MFLSLGVVRSGRAQSIAKGLPWYAACGLPGTGVRLAAHPSSFGTRMPDKLNTETTTFAELVQRIAERVRPVCAHMPEEEFRALVEQMARIEHKYIHYPKPVPRELRSSEVPEG